MLLLKRLNFWIAAAKDKNDDMNKNRNKDRNNNELIPSQFYIVLLNVCERQKAEVKKGQKE